LKFLSNLRDTHRKNKTKTESRLLALLVSSPHWPAIILGISIYCATLVLTKAVGNTQGQQANCCGPDGEATRVSGTWNFLTSSNLGQETVSRDFRHLVIFHQTIPSTRSLIHALKYFRISLRIRRDINEYAA
jgi:hypothetical protein